MKQRPTLSECLAEYESVKASEFDPGKWMRLINKMRIWGYSVQAEPIVNHLRELAESKRLPATRKGIEHEF